MPTSTDRRIMKVEGVYGIVRQVRFTQCPQEEGDTSWSAAMSQSNSCKRPAFGMVVVRLPYRRFQDRKRSTSGILPTIGGRRALGDQDGRSAPMGERIAVDLGVVAHHDQCRSVASFWRAGVPSSRHLGVSQERDEGTMGRWARGRTDTSRRGPQSRQELDRRSVRKASAPLLDLRRDQGGRAELDDLRTAGGSHESNLRF